MNLNRVEFTVSSGPKPNKAFLLCFVGKQTEHKFEFQPDFMQRMNENERNSWV